MFMSSFVIFSPFRVMVQYFLSGSMGVDFARPRDSISIIRILNVPSLRVKPCFRIKSLASFHLPFPMMSRNMQSMAWSFSSILFMGESCGFVRIFVILSSDNHLHLQCFSDICSWCF